MASVRALSTSISVSLTLVFSFEIEHADNFARARGGRRPGGYPGRDPPSQKPHYPPGCPHPTPTETDEEEHHDWSDEQEPSAGYIHIYRTIRRLDRLLYIDGLSTGKTNLGTLDSQDILLLNATGGSRGMFGEY